MNITARELRELRGDKTVVAFAEDLQCSKEVIYRLESHQRKGDDRRISDWLQERVNIYKASFASKPAPPKKYKTDSVADRTRKLRERIIEVYRQKQSEVS